MLKDATMKKIISLGLVAPLFFVCGAGADILKERKREEKVPIHGLTIRAYSDTFKKNEPARACASGNYVTPFGLFIFDANGNCVARDDLTQPVTADDCFADWIPPAEQSYSIEVRNAGLDQNTFQFALR